MNLLLDSEMTLKEIKATRAHIVSIDRTGGCFDFAEVDGAGFLVSDEDS